MLVFFPKSPTPSLRSLPFHLPSDPFSTSPPPATEDSISDLIRRQTSPDAARRTFRWATKLPSFRPSPSVYHSMILSLLSFNRLSLALQILRDIPSAAGAPPADATFIALIRHLGRSNQPGRALHLLDEMPLRFGIPNPSLKVLNSVLDALVNHDIDRAREFFRRRMSGRGDDITFGTLMKGLCRTNRIAEAFRLLKLMKASTSATPNAVVYNTLLHCLCRNGKFGRARSLMSEMKCHSNVTFNTMISAYCGEGNLVQALVMMEKCLELDLVPDMITITKIVELLGSQGRAMEAIEVLQRVEESGGVVDVVCYNTLIKGFCGMEKPEAGKRVLKEMEMKGCLPNVHTYNALIAGFCNSMKVDSAMDLYREMESDGVKLEFETFEILIRGFCLSGRVLEGFKILGLMEEERGGRENRISPYNSILYGLYKEGRVEEAYEFLVRRMESSFPRAVERSLRILELCKEGKNVGEAKMVYDQMVKVGGTLSALVNASLIEGMSKEGNVREAFDLMNEMVEKGFFPVVSTFNALICGFCQGGQLRSAAKLLEEMVRRGCSPDAESYSPLIGVLCRQGDMEGACSFLVQMVERGLVPDDHIWNCLLLSGMPCDIPRNIPGPKHCSNGALPANGGPTHQSSGLTSRPMGPSSADQDPPTWRADLQTSRPSSPPDLETGRPPAQASRAPHLQPAEVGQGRPPTWRRAARSPAQTGKPTSNAYAGRAPSSDLQHISGTTSGVRPPRGRPPGSAGLRDKVVRDYANPLLKPARKAR